MKNNNKQITKRTISAIMAGCMALGSGAALAADLSNTDIPTDHWAADVLSDFIDNGYLSGYGNNTYKPDQNIIRAEFITLINKVQGYTETSDQISNFTDVKESDWCYEHLAAALQAGYLTGTSATTLSPNDLITREQALTMIGHVLGLDDGTREDLEGFPDADQVSDWAVPYVGALVRAGIISGRSDGETETLSPQANMTRAEGVQILSNCLASQSKSVYVLMNIPYDEFYAAEVNNDVSVDAFTSATLTKTKTGTLAGGSYHNEDGSEITGVTFPVKLGEGVTLADLADYTLVTDSDSVTITVTNRGQTSTTTYEGADALFENESYAYYVLNEEPEFYKELTLDEDGNLCFGEVQGEVQTISGVTYDLFTESDYGDYELMLYGFDEIDTSTDKVYGVVVSTEENDYGLRHLENIWRVTDLAWCTGFVDSVHGCPTSSAHYESMMGQSIQKITYYTSKGIFELQLDEAVYIPIKFENTFTVEDAAATDLTTAVTMDGFPEDFEVAYSITDANGNSVENATCDGKNITWDYALSTGTYTLTATDESGKYAPVSTTFQLTTDATIATFDKESLALVAAEGVSEEEFANYLSSISSVSVNGTAYSPSGHGAVTIINADGTINLEASVFEAGETYTIEVSADGYATDLVFQLTIPQEDETTYTGTATVYPNEDNEFDAYDIMIDVVVQNDVIQSISLNSSCTIASENTTYFNKAINGTTSKTGIAEQLTGTSVSEIDSVQYDVVTNATCSCDAIVEAVKDALK